MFSYEYASKSKKNLIISLALTSVRSVVLNAALIAACFLFLLLS